MAIATFLARFKGQSRVRSFQGAAHQRCRMHFARNLLAHVPKTHADMAAAAFRTLFAQPDAATVAATLGRGPRPAGGRFPRSDRSWTAPEVLALSAFPGRTGRRSGPPARWNE